MISSEKPNQILGLRSQQETLQQLEASHNLLKALTVAQSQFIIDANPRILFDNLLENILELTHSSYGFIGEVIDADGQPQLETHMKVRGKPNLKTHAIANISGNEENTLKGLGFHNLKTLFGTVMVTGQPVIANNPATDLCCEGIPGNYLPLNSFLCLPFFYKDNQLVGMVGIANRPGGYDESSIAYLEPFLVTCSNVIAAVRNDTRRQQAEAALLQRTTELQQVLDQLLEEVVERKQIENALRESEARERQKAIQLQEVIEKLKCTQSQLVQTEKMSSLGQLVAGIAHEINNPINFLCGNLRYVSEYTKNLLVLVKKYQHYYPKPNSEIKALMEQFELDFVKEDLSKIISSMKIGAGRIHDIVLSLRTFSRLDEASIKTVNIHEGLDSTLLLLQYRLQRIQLIKAYSDLPLVKCYAGQLNQVFMNLLVNAIDAVEQRLERAESAGEDFLPQIQIRTELLDSKKVVIHIADNGVGIPNDIKQRIFDPFFTTKPIGKGTGLGLSIAHQIIDKHQGHLCCRSVSGEGAEFIIEIPLLQPEI